MKVLATGPESSGTNYLTDLLAAAGADAVHRSQPEGPDWIDMTAMVNDFDAVVVVIRGRRAHLASVERRDIEPDQARADGRRRKALARLAPILGHPNVHVVTYESLAHPAEQHHILATLGLDPDRPLPPWRDENAKYYP